MSGVFPPECVSCERLVFWVQHVARGLWPHSCFSVWLSCSSQGAGGRQHRAGPRPVRFRPAGWLGPVPSVRGGGYGEGLLQLGRLGV